MILALRHKRIVTLAISIAVIVLCAAVYLKLQGKVILQSLQYFVEDKIGKSLNAKVTMDSLQPSVIGPTILNGFNITKACPDDTPFIFKSSRLIIYHNIVQLAAEKLFRKHIALEKKIVFKIENGFLYKGDKPIFSNISGSGRIINNNLIFNDINGKVYDFPLSVYGKISADTSKIDINIKSDSDKLRGKVCLSNYALRPHAVGTLEFNNGYKIYFSGDFDIKPGESISAENLMLQNAALASAKLDFSKKRFYAELTRKDKTAGSNAKNLVCLLVDFSKEDLLQVSILLDHVAIGSFDIKSQADLQLAMRPGGVDGKITTSGTILDCKPFGELSGEFCIEGNVFKISSLKWGEDYNLSGSLNLYRPYDMDLVLGIKDGNLSQLLLVSDVESDGTVSGKINGQIRTQGPLRNPATVVKLECGGGRLGDLDYESMNVNLRGEGSVLKVVDSRILRKEGYINLSGDVDLKRLWSHDPCKGLAWTCGNEAIVWNGWDIIKQANSQELQMQKGVGRDKEFMVTFKSYLNDEQSWQDSQGPNQNETVGVQYNLDEAKRVKMQLRNNEEVFSLENKIRF